MPKRSLTRNLHVIPWGTFPCQMTRLGVNRIDMAFRVKTDAKNTSNFDMEFHVKD